MLNDKRIEEAEFNVKEYLKEGLLKREDFQDIVFNVLMKNCRESIDLANFISKNKKTDLWIIVISYYSMYYIANAVLYKMGYKVGEKISHKVTSDALIVFIRKKLEESMLENYEDIKEQALAGIKADEIIGSFDFERKKRNVIQYHTKEIDKHSKALTSLDRAKKFVMEMEKLLD